MELENYKDLVADTQNFLDSNFLQARYFPVLHVKEAEYFKKILT